MSEQRKVTRPNNGRLPQDQRNRRKDQPIIAEAHNGNGNPLPGTVIVGQHPDGDLTPDIKVKTTTQIDTRDVVLTQDLDQWTIPDEPPKTTFLSRSQIVMACHYNLVVCVTTEWKILKFIFSPGIQVQVSK